VRKIAAAAGGHSLHRLLAAGCARIRYASAFPFGAGWQWEDLPLSDGSPPALSASRKGRRCCSWRPSRPLTSWNGNSWLTPQLPVIHGCTILSFERLAHFIFAALGKPSPDMLDDEGRVMVLRGLLAKKRNDLKLFRASARLTGFARQLSLVLRELQRHQQTPESLRDLAARVRDNQGLACKLHDLAALLQHYLDWLKAHQLQDADCLLAAATEALGYPKAEIRSGVEGQVSRGEGRESPKVRSPKSEVPEHATRTATRLPPLRSLGRWFRRDFTSELELLAALLPYCDNATVTFCLRPGAQREAFLAVKLVVVRKSFEDCRKRLGGLPDADAAVEVLPRHPTQSRFINNPVLAHLERHWSDPQPYPSPLSPLSPRERAGVRGGFGFPISVFLRISDSDFGFPPPSPRPSPEGRGRIVLSRPPNRALVERPRIRILGLGTSDFLRPSEFGLRPSDSPSAAPPRFRTSDFGLSTPRYVSSPAPIPMPRSRSPPARSCATSGPVAGSGMSPSSCANWKPATSPCSASSHAMKSLSSSTAANPSPITPSPS